jgi:hypothetical protein
VNQEVCHRLFQLKDRDYLEIILASTKYVDSIGTLCEPYLAAKY